MDVSIIIVNYNTRSLLIDCINSIYKHTSGVCFEIVIIDNASTDGSQKAIKEMFPDVLLIESARNLGFGKANNLGAKIAEGKYLLMLNSDCYLIENTVKTFFDFMEQNNHDKKIGAIGAMLFDKNMVINKSYFRFPSKLFQIKLLLILMLNKILRLSVTLPQNANYDLNKTNNEVDFLSGAGLFILKEAFLNLKGFDEQFFLYFEETDLQFQMEKKGWKRIILRNASIVHLEGFSSKSNTYCLKKLIIHRDSMYKYYKKNSNAIIYTVFYLIITPLLMFPLFDGKYNLLDKKHYLNMLLRRNTKGICN